VFSAPSAQAFPAGRPISLSSTQLPLGFQHEYGIVHFGKQQECYGRLCGQSPTPSEAV
jgi:hypothetical protein